MKKPKKQKAKPKRVKPFITGRVYVDGESRVVKVPVRMGISPIPELPRLIRLKGSLIKWGKLRGPIYATLTQTNPVRYDWIDIPETVVTL